MYQPNYHVAIKVIKLFGQEMRLGMRNAPISLLLVSILTAGLLFGSRWFSYLGNSPIFISEVILSMSVLFWLFSKKEIASKFGESGHKIKSDLAKFLLAVLLLWTLARGLFSIYGGYAILDILRDLLPILYMFIAILVSSQIARQSQHSRNKLSSIFRTCLGLHLLWCLGAIVSRNYSGFQVGSIAQAGVFSFRADIDTTLVVIYFVLVLKAWENGEHRTVSAIKLCLCLVVITFSPARASLLALLVCLAWYLSSKQKKQQLLDNNANLVASRKFIIFASLSVVVFVLGFTTSGARLLGPFGLTSGSNSDLANSGIGTANARELVWTQVLAWVNGSTSSIFFGEGFGVNFLDVTNTLQFLEGTTYTGVRSPHNFLITLIARLGWPSAIVFSVAILIVLLRFRRAVTLDDLSFLSMTILLAFIPIALLGVVLEAPFGAIPFYFSLGVLLGSDPKT